LILVDFKKDGDKVIAFKSRALPSFVVVPCKKRQRALHLARIAQISNDWPPAAVWPNARPTTNVFLFH